MFILGICLHFAFMFSIFDIYFKSPIVRDVVPYQPSHQALGDRLVLFVVDGLRAESFTNYTTMSYLREVANTYGRWGVSNTRMPTESRPGHVAVIAGFYEDPSAVVKGWKENPVDFDSVFNESSYTWGWGTYDILEIFTKGTVEEHIFMKKLDPYDQTFSTDKNTTHLDAWVFENVRDFFDKAKENVSINELLHFPKIVFFLHLLGTDTSGHTHKPKSPNFLTTLRFVDEGIKKTEGIIRSFYKDDGRTTFLMTSDHGMTDWGSHGAGQKHETETPYVIWGSGVQQVKKIHPDPNNFDMSLEHRFDINQADLAPLMSTVLSIPVPVNSVGRVSTDILNISLADKAKALYSNARQLASQYDKKRQDIEDSAITFLYKPFKPFNKQKYKEVIEFTEQLLSNENKGTAEYEKIILLSNEIMELSLLGLDYYHNYYQKPLLVLVTLSFIGWIMCLVKTILEQNINTQDEPSDLKKHKNYNIHFVNIIFSTLIFLGVYLIFVQNLPYQYYVYVLMPLILWWSALKSFKVWTYIFSQLITSRHKFSLWIESICYICGSFTLGLSFTHRWVLSFPLCGMALWPLFSTTRNYFSTQILLAWSAGCILLSFFSFMPVIGKDTFIELVIAAGAMWLVISVIFHWKILLPLYYKSMVTKKDIVLSTIQMILLAFSLQNVYRQSIRFDNGIPVSSIDQVMAWLIAATSLIVPLVFSKRLICRLNAIYTSILNLYLLLSVSHEGLFMVTFTFNVACWMFIEFRLLHSGVNELLKQTFENEEKASKNLLTYERSIDREDFRRSFFFILYIILAFFGTGNIASLNSFEVRWVTCFTTSFKPFVITGLILMKTLAPFLTVACTFRAIQHFTQAPTGYLHVIVLIYSNIMGIQLLYNVKNYGSWLDIGTSISQFVIVQVITLFIVLINQVARIFSEFNFKNFVNVKQIKKID